MGNNFASGTQLGAYTVNRLVGKGGMGEVYEATEHRLRRRVALKVIAPQNADQHDEADLVRRFIHEAHTLAQINHPNVVTIYSIDEDQGMKFIAMEFVDGSPFKKILSLVALSADEAAPLFLQMLEGLRALHENDVLHRDLKPNNIMVRNDGTVKVLDFGIAKRINDQHQEQTSPSILVGTLAYLAPEILTGTRANVRSDLWSLGAIFYECLTGQTLISLNTRQVRGVRAYPGCDVIFPEQTVSWIPEEMRIIIGKMCDGRPKHRFNDTGEAIAALKRYQQNRPPLPLDFEKSLSNLLRSIEGLDGHNKPAEGDDITEKRALAVSLMKAASAASPPMKETVSRPRIDTADITVVSLDSIQLRSARRNKSRQSQYFRNSYVLGASAAAALLVLMISTRHLFKKGNSDPAPTPAQSSAVQPPPREVASLPPPSNQPVFLIGPADRSILQLKPYEVPTLTWSRTLSADEEELEIATEPGFNAPIVQEVVSGNYFRPARSLPEGIYYWRLLSLQGNGRTAGPAQFQISYVKPVVNSVAASTPATREARVNLRAKKPKPIAVAPFLREPELRNSSHKFILTGSGNAPVFSWTPVKHARLYRIEVSESPDFSHLIGEETLAETRYRLKKVLPGRVYWRVRAIGAADSMSAYSNPSFVDIRLSPPQLAARYKMNKDHAFGWKPIAQAEKYMVRFSPDRGLANATEKLTDQPQLALEMKSKPLFVEVAAANAAGERVSEFSKPAMVEPARDKNAPEIISPNGARVSIGNSGRLTVVFSWTPVPNATDYRIEIANDSDFKDLIDSHEVKPTKYVVRNKTFNGHIYWRVRTAAPGSPSSWSSTGSFQVITPKLAQGG